MQTVDVGSLQPGMEIHAVHGDKLGKIVEVHSDHVVVEKGFFFPSDHVIPTSAIASVGEDGHVYLKVDRETAVSQDWRQPTTMTASTSPGMSEESADPTYDRPGRLSPAGRQAVEEATGAEAPLLGMSDEPADRATDQA